MSKQTNVARKLETLHNLLNKIGTTLERVGLLWFDAATALVDLFNDADYRAKLGDKSEDQIGDALNNELPAWTPCNFWQFRDLLAHFPNRATWSTKSIAELYDDMLRQKAAPDPYAPPRIRRSFTVAQYETLERELEAAKKTIARLKRENAKLRKQLTAREPAAA